MTSWPNQLQIHSVQIQNSLDLKQLEHPPIFATNTNTIQLLSLGFQTPNVRRYLDPKTYLKH